MFSSTFLINGILEFIELKTKKMHYRPKIKIRKKKGLWSNDLANSKNPASLTWLKLQPDIGTQFGIFFNNSYIMLLDSYNLTDPAICWIIMLWNLELLKKIQYVLFWFDYLSWGLWIQNYSHHFLFIFKFWLFFKTKMYLFGFLFNRFGKYVIIWK